MANLSSEQPHETLSPFLPLRDLDIVFISYDEPQADRHWMDLKGKRPDAKRVHGVTGIDRAHKYAARASASEYFVTVDGDTVVDSAFFDLVLDKRQLTPRMLVTWPSRNSVNGLVYGNGSLKCWHRRSVLAMRTHETAPTDSVAHIDFGRIFERVVPRDCFSETHTNGSAEHAFRAGFREGIKLSLIDGGRPAGPRLRDLSATARRRLQLWCSVGADVTHGLWSMLGARLGCLQTNLEGWDVHHLHDYERLKQMWADAAAIGESDWSLFGRLRALGDRIREELRLEVEELTPSQSHFFKETSSGEEALGHAPINVPYAVTCGAALTKLATLYRRGHGVPTDPDEAARLYALADKFASRNGTKNLALSYLHGSGVKRDRRRAVALLRKATAAGSADAPFHLAQALREESALPADKAEIVELLQLAGSRGCAPALRSLGQVLEEDEDLDGAAAAYTRASALGDDEAERLLRHLHARFGHGIGGAAYPSRAATG